MKTAIVGDLGKVSMCKRVMKNETLKDGEIPFFKISTFGDTPKTYISKELFNLYKEKFSFPKKGDVLISAAGTIGKTVIFDGNDAYFQDSNIVWIDNDETLVINSYLYYYYQTEPWIATSGSTIKRLYNNNIRSLKIHYPEKSEQRKISKVLSDLDAKIELNNKINSELRSMAKLIYDYWFVQYDFPNEDGKPYKSSGGKMVYNEELKREVPDGWEIKELGEEIEIERGISYKSAEIKGGGMPMINLNSFNLDGTYKDSGIKMYSGKFIDKKLAKPGDLLIAATDVTREAEIIGKAIIIPDYLSNVVYSMDVTKVTPSENLSNKYLMMLFNSNHYHNYIKWFASGTTVLHLNLDGMKWYKAEIPPKNLLDKYDSFCESITKRINSTITQNQKLTELRDWLLPMLLNGQVTVK